MRCAVFSGLAVILISLSGPVVSAQISSSRPAAEQPEDLSNSTSARVVPLRKLVDQLPLDLHDKLSKLPPETKAYMVFDTRIVGPSSEGACGHIVVQKAPANVDPQITSKIPDGFASNMPVFRGLPPCPQDVRDEIQARVKFPPASAQGAFVPPSRTPRSPRAPAQPKP